MQKSLLLLGALLLLHFAQAQVSGGLKAGMNAATIRAYNKAHQEPWDTINWRTGFHAGAFLQVPLSRRVSLQPELQYSLKGYGIKERVMPDKGPISLHYITVPLLVGVSLGERLSLVAGPEFGYLVSSNARARREGIWGLNDYKAIDLGADMGVSYKINDVLGVALRYNHGLSDLIEGDLYDRYGQLEGHFKGVRNRVFQASFSYRLSPK